MKVGTEMKKMFNHGRSAEAPAGLPSENLNLGSNSLLARADAFCKHVKKPKKPNKPRRERYVPYKRTTVKEVQKSLIMVEFQGSNISAAVLVSLKEYQKIYDGSIRFLVDMSEDEVRDEIVRLVQKKESETHDFNCLMPNDFDFVRCVNRQVKVIDGDSPFDGNGLCQVYKNGSIYIRLNTPILKAISVSTVAMCMLDLVLIEFSISISESVPCSQR